MLAHLLMVVTAAAIGTTASSQSVADAPGSDEVIIGAWSDPAKCNRESAQNVSFAEVLEKRDKLTGACVAVEGFWSSRALFGKASHGNAKGSNSTRSLAGYRIGIYAREEVLQHAPKHAMRYRMIGVVGQCETEWPGAMMVLGYCHYTSGPILKVSQVVPQKASSVR
ncbi:hypothetical protein [Sphingomonas sp. BK580]|uniref:hypothetical protein n=1 Tax=Sphingomonas sp. BK580 TaxID=2586972 RepID=UPI001619E481|nr:hypothetical protein [Sphingomonas sp. BK580]MBB3695880.1 hypothetical protein [Sphingomonas sp. BK580]